MIHPGEYPAGDPILAGYTAIRGGFVVLSDLRTTRIHTQPGDHSASVEIRSVENGGFGAGGVS